MDLSNLPTCAMYRSVGTVIVRIRMEEQDRCREYTGWCGKTVLRQPSGCERCNRTRLITKYNSDCDSVVDKYRPYRASAARSRYVNVCAAVCLLLLVGGLSPQCSAAPHRSTMHRQRRATDENHLWANPCDYNDSNSKSADDVKSLASQLSTQAHNALSSTAKYKDTFAFQLHTYESFDRLLLAYENEEWLRKFPWFKDEVLPKEKVINSTVSDEYMNRLMTKINDVMPAMYKGLKMVVAGLYAFSNEGLNDSVIADETLKENITQTMHNCRAVLCYFNDIMKSRNLEIPPLSDSEVPDFKTDAKLSTGLLLYRDTLNYLEYLAQVFHKFSITESA